MNLESLSDKELDENILNIVKQEREILSRVLEHLREVERRRLFSALGYQSLFDYAIRRLNYSEDQACRRIAAMRLIREIPEIQTKIEAGSISLSHIGIAHRFFKNEGHVERDQKIALFAKLENTSKRDAEKIAVSLASKPLVPLEIVRQVTVQDIELRFTVSEEVMGKIELLRGLLAHKHPQISLGNLMNELCEAGLDKFDPRRFVDKRTRQHNENVMEKLEQVVTYLGKKNRSVTSRAAEFQWRPKHHGQLDADRPAPARVTEQRSFFH